MTPTGEYAAFISYASENREKADKICASLEARGLVCWIAPRDVRPGRDYADEIILGIEQSASVVLVLSEAANTSEFVPREIERAVSKQKPLFPVRIEHVVPEPGLELFISGTQWIDAWTGNWDNHMKRLARGVSDVTSGTATATISSGRRSQTNGRSFNTMGVAAAVVLLMGLSGAGGWWFSREAPAPQTEALDEGADPPAETPAAPAGNAAPPAVAETQAEPVPPSSSAPASSRPTVTLTVTVPVPSVPSVPSREGTGARGAVNPPPAPAENLGELDELRSLYDDLSLRGETIDESLNQLWESMKPASPRIDMATHQRSLRTSLARGRDALQAGNAAGARRFLDVARADLAVLEQFLNR